jgi:hypothetical protein
MTEISQNETNKSTKSTYATFSQKSTTRNKQLTYITQSKRYLQAAQASNSHRRISHDRAAVANLQVGQRIESSLKHKTTPHRKQQTKPGHDRSAPSKRPCDCSKAHKSDPADPQPRVTMPRVDTIVTQQSQENILLTSPTASATFPLLAPETTTGVYRSVLVPSPTCAERYHHQPNIHIPHDTQRPLENKQQESPGHMRSLPSRKLRLHSRVHKSVPAHVLSDFHNPTQKSNIAK